jgi:hypothetical protein
MIKIVVTQEKFDELFSIEAWLNFGQLTNQEAYALMLKFVVDDEGKPCEEAQAREMFKTVPKKEWGKYLADFMRLVNEAFVNPTSGTLLPSLSKVE